MARRCIGALSFAAIIALLLYSILSDQKVSASPKEVNVISRTSGHEVLTAVVLNNELKISLKNNHKDTITAFVISFADTKIRADFAYSDIHFGIEPGDTFQKNYPVSPWAVGDEPPPLYFLGVVLKDGSQDGDPKETRDIRDERLGEKIQILRTLRVLEKGPRDLKAVKNDIVAALDAGESETRIMLSELQPNMRTDNKFSDALRSGLQWGREKMLRRFEALEQLPTESREHGFIEFKDRSHKLLAKL